VALVCCWTSSLHAQELRLRPYADVSLPTRISVQDRLLHIGQRIGVAVGARLTVSFNRHFEAVTGVSYSPGYALVQGAGNRFSFSAGSHVLTASTEARYWLLPHGRRFSWEVHTGSGVAFGGTPAYLDLFESSTVSGIAGTTVRYQVGRLVGLKVRVQERIYRLRFGNRPTGGTSSPLQLSFGLDLPFLKPAS
jgi:hypothetical protein